MIMAHPLTSRHGQPDSVGRVLDPLSPVPMGVVRRRDDCGFADCRMRASARVVSYNSKLALVLIIILLGFIVIVVRL
jgi:hypothetical protein